MGDLERAARWLADELGASFWTMEDLIDALPKEGLYVVLAGERVLVLKK